MSEEKSASSSSSQVSNNNTKDDLLSINDVIAISNGEGGFLLGKLTEERTDGHVLTIYHHKLDTKTHMFKTSEVLLNFGNAGAKTIFEMSNQQQRNLLELVHHPDQYSRSLLELVLELKKNEENRNKMLDLINNLFGELKVGANARGVLLMAFDDQIINYNEFVEMICKIAVQQQTDTAINELASALANATFKIRILTVIENKLSDESFVNFLKKTLWEIVDLVAQSNGNHRDESFVLFSLHLMRLMGNYCRT